MKYGYRPTKQDFPVRTDILYDIFWITPRGGLKFIQGVTWNPEDNCFHDKYREYPYEQIKSWLFPNAAR